MAMNSKQKKSKTQQLIERDGLICCLCKKFQLEDQLTIDHVRPRSKGGSNRMINLRLACLECNQKRGDKPFLPGDTPTWNDVFQLGFLFIWDHGGNEQIVNLCLAHLKSNTKYPDTPFPHGHVPTWKDIFQLVLLFIWDMWEHGLIEASSFVNWIEQVQIQN